MKNIGIVIRDFEENNKVFVGCRKDVIDVFLKYSVNIFLIPIFYSFDKIISLVNLCDGIVLTGGDHFLDNDFLLVKYLYDNNIPTLGICLGMQIMALSFGSGREIEAGFIHSQKNSNGHNIIIKKDSMLYKIIGKKCILVNSRHNTAISATNLSVCALSLDGLIEAVEDVNKRFFLGVGWHPESLNNKNSDLIFDAFIKSLM